LPGTGLSTRKSNMKKLAKARKELIGTVKIFDGTFKLFQTDNIFRFLQKTKRNTNSIIGCIQPIVKIKSTRGIIVGILNKKEGLFMCSKFPSSVFKFPINWKTIFNLYD